jgi:acetyltransferase-like isoleucine patch superfamily enzyme
MNLRRIFVRFLLPSSFITLYVMWKYKAKVSPKAELELSQNLELGEGCEIASFVKIKSSAGKLAIGAHSEIANFTFIASGESGISIGDYCMMGPGVSIVGNGYEYDDIDMPTLLQPKTSKGITIGNNVWLGAGVQVLDGSHIEDGCIISANSVVTGHIPKNSIANGMPASVIFTRR